jgi:hypothetical protein
MQSFCCIPCTFALQWNILLEWKIIWFGFFLNFQNQSSSFFQNSWKRWQFYRRLFDLLLKIWRTENIYQKSVLRFLRTMVKFSNWLFGFIQGVVSFKTLRASSYLLPFLIAAQHWWRPHPSGFLFSQLCEPLALWQKPTTWTTPITVGQHVTQGCSLFQHCAFECCWLDPFVVSS